MDPEIDPALSGTENQQGDPTATDTDTQPVADDQQGSGETLFTEEERKGLPTGFDERWKGMEKKFTQRQQSVAAREKQLDALIQQQSEVLAQTAAMREKPASNTGSARERLGAMMEAARPEDRKALQTIVEAMREEFQPVAARSEEVRADSELREARVRYQDFDQVVTPQAVRDLTRRFPDVYSPEVAYRHLKHESLARENAAMRTELQKHRAGAKARAGTSAPGGPSSDSVQMDAFFKMSPADRRKLDIHQLADMAEREQRGRGAT